ncbi:tetratricopeptide repeat protein [Nostoc linckia FACHB-104]|nr:tetratricopeptide repeat protein [Nostoc linckia FACHB-104]
MKKVTKLSIASYYVGNRRKIKFFRLFVYFIMALLCSLSSPIMAVLPGIAASSQPIVKEIVAPASLLQQGKLLYDAGKFSEAVQVLQQAVKEYQTQGDRIKQAATLSNLSLAYQQLGAWQEAQKTITDSLNLLKVEQNSQSLQIFAQSLDIQGRLQLATGQGEAALATWQQAAKIYTQLKNESGVVRTLINQAQAWRSQGAYLRSVEILEQAYQKLQTQPNSIEKAVGLRSLGDSLLAIGDGKKSEAVLKQSREIAKSLQSNAEIGAIVFSLGNNARTQQKTAEAIAYYQEAVQLSPSPLTKVQAQLNLLSLLIEDKQLSTAETLLPAIQSQLAQLPPSRASIYAAINFAQSLNKLTTPNSPLSTPHSALSTQHSALSTPNSALILTTAIQQSRNLGDQKTEAYALGSLANLYEQAQKLPEALKFTKQALVLAQTNNAPEIAYRLEWQLGRIFWAQKDLTKAIAAYDGAVETLNSLRRDLVAINQDVQFSFRDSVEPVYRESVELLLQSQAGTGNDKILDKARQRIETLQLAELDNFFREACLLGQNVALDQVVDKDNPNTAILYPIILPEEIQSKPKSFSQRVMPTAGYAYANHIYVI